MNALTLSALAVLLDLLIGDPDWIPHPVILIGKWIGLVDKRCNQSTLSPRRRKMMGVLLTASTLALSGAIPWGLLWSANRLSPVVGIALNIFLIATTIAWNGLIRVGRQVDVLLSKDDLPGARRAVAMIVGRDTATLSPVEITRATVETLAENLVDAIVSPLFFACIGGAPLALMYRAANTLDSMVGYRNERYRDFGWCSARTDDVLNFIPGRITAIFLWMALASLQLNPMRAWRTMRADAKKHPSPNSGIPESMVAGALGVQLGGVNHYQGIPSHRATLGTAIRPLDPADINRTIRIVQTTGWFLLLVVGAGGWLAWQG